MDHRDQEGGSHHSKSPVLETQMARCLKRPVLSESQRWGERWKVGHRGWKGCGKDRAERLGEHTKVAGDISRAWRPLGAVTAFCCGDTQETWGRSQAYPMSLSGHLGKLEGGFGQELAGIKPRSHWLPLCFFFFFFPELRFQLQASRLPLEPCAKFLFFCFIFQVRSHVTAILLPMPPP